MKSPSTPSNAEPVRSPDLRDKNSEYDLVVVGAGPSGLAAAVNASLYGLSILIIEAVALGGHVAGSATAPSHGEAGTRSMDIESVHRLYEQIRQSDVHIIMAHKVVSTVCSPAAHRLEVNSGETISSRSIVIATGARYEQLDVPNYGRFEYRGIHYVATGQEAAECLGEDVVVVGAGNPAGKAAVFLSGTANHVHLLVKHEALGSEMSSYLIERILHSPHITLHTNTEIQSLSGDATLREVTWKNLHSCVCHTRAINNLFVMIGLTPQSEWLHGQLELDEDGFVRTGFSHTEIEDSPFSTSCAGVFAIGDVRSGSTKRVLSALHEGTVVAADVHRYLGVGDWPEI